jgi:hypothetical protein
MIDKYDDETIKKLGHEFLKLNVNCKVQVEKIESLIKQLKESEKIELYIKL